MRLWDDLDHREARFLQCPERRYERLEQLQTPNQEINWHEIGPHYLETARTFVEIMEADQRVHQAFHPRHRFGKGGDCTDQIRHTVRRVPLKNRA